MKQEKWFDRKFDFGTSQHIFPSIIERLSGTPARLEEKFLCMPEHIAKTRSNGGWSIKENLGHLADLEPLWQGRLEDILNGMEELRPTDLGNRKTSEAGHNEVPVNELLRRFRTLRQQTVSMIEVLTEEQIVMSALHPRLKTPMRVMDHFLFVAEHDDHHLASITALTRKLL